MKKLNLLFLIYMLIGFIYFTLPLTVYSQGGYKDFILAVSGWLTVCLSSVGYGLNGGK